MSYICSTCNKQFDRYWHLVRHSNKKIKCQQNVPIIPIAPVVPVTSMVPIVLNENVPIRNLQIQPQILSNLNVPILNIPGNDLVRLLYDLQTLIKLYPNSPYIFAVSLLERDLDGTNLTSLLDIISKLITINPNSPFKLTILSPNISNNFKLNDSNNILDLPETLSKENVHKCNHCNSTFSRKYVLDRHLKHYCNVLKQQKTDIIIVETKPILELNTNPESIKEHELNNKQDNALNMLVYLFSEKDNDLICNNYDNSFPEDNINEHTKCKILIENEYHDEQLKHLELDETDLYLDALSRGLYQNDSSVTNTDSNNVCYIDSNNATTSNSNNINVNISDSNNDNIINSNNVTNNIVMVNFGEENMKETCMEYLLAACRRGYNAVPHLAKMVHFDPDHPERHNALFLIQKINMHQFMKTINLFIEINRVVLDQLYEDKKNFILENIGLVYDKLTPHEKKTHKRWINSDKNKHNK